jgi:phosphoribosylaminoimidazole-succinocarboxamide synthase
VKIAGITGPEPAEEPLLGRQQNSGKQERMAHRPAQEAYVSVEERVDLAVARDSREEPLLPVAKKEGPKETILREENEVPLIAAGKIDEMTREIRRINQTLSELHKSLSALSAEVKGVERVAKAQETANSILREIATLLEVTKEKQGKFRFW